MYHAHGGLTFISMHLYQRWDRSDICFILRPFLIGMAFGALKNCARAKHKGYYPQRWLYLPSVDAGHRSINALHEKARRPCLPSENVAIEHFSDRISGRLPNSKFSNATIIRKQLNRFWFETMYEDRKRTTRSRTCQGESKINMSTTSITLCSQGILDIE